MQFKNIMSLSFFIIIYNSTHSMELIRSTFQENAVPVAVSIGIGAAGGAAQAMIFNTINNHYHYDAKCSIAKNSLRGAIESLAVYGTTKGKNFKPSTIFDIAMLTGIYQISLIGLSSFDWRLRIQVKNAEKQAYIEQHSGLSSNMETTTNSNIHQPLQNAVKQYMSDYIKGPRTLLSILGAVACGYYNLIKNNNN